MDMDGVCVPVANTCGAGTVLVGNTCVAIDAPPDAYLIDAPVDALLPCGPGTHQIGNECLPNTSMPGFEVRVAQDPVIADGYEKVGVLAIGPTVDAGASADGGAGIQVQLSVVPANAGTIDQPLLTLGPSGTSTFITPCNSVLDPTCVEPFQIVMTPAGDPQRVLATSPILHSVAPTPVASATPCLGGGNRMYIDGNDFVWNGTMLVTQAAFDVAPIDNPNTPNEINVTVDPQNTLMQGCCWQINLDSYRMGQPLRAQVYPLAERYLLEPPFLPGMEINGDARGCNTLIGSFQIEELVVDNAIPANVHRLTLTFIQHCELDPTTRLQGCVHIEQ
jgi:hypothetical protein